MTTWQDSVTQRMADQGLTVSPRPSPEMPQIVDYDSLTDLTDEQLIDLFQEFVAWNDYATSVLSEASVSERMATRRVERAEAQFMTDEWTGKSTDRVTVQKARMANNMAVSAAHDKADQAYAYRKMVESIVMKLDRDSNLISRELTRRTTSSDKPTRRVRSAV